MSVDENEKLFSLEAWYLPSERVNQEDRPIVNLWVAVMISAFNDILREVRRLKLTHLPTLPTPQNVTNIHAASALQWVLSDSNVPGSFVFLCYLLNSEPEIFRHNLMWCAKDKDFEYFTRIFG